MGRDTGGVLCATREAAGVVAMDAPRVDRERAFPAESLRALGEVGALGLVVPAEHGGAGGALAALAEACETLGAACASSGMVFLMHSVTAATIAAGGGARAGDAARAHGLRRRARHARVQRARHRRPLLRAGAEGGALERRRRGHGRKSFVTSGGHADVYLVLVQGEAEGSADAYLVSRRPAGRRAPTARGAGSAWPGTRASRSSSTTSSSATPTGSAPPGGAIGLVFDAVAPFFLVGLAAVNVGIAAAAAAAATAHAPDRRYPDGSSLAEIQYVQHLIADMDLARAAGPPARAGGGAARRGGRPVGARRDHGGEGRRDRGGGRGHRRKRSRPPAARATRRALPIERHLRDARAGAVMAPTNAVLRSWIGKALAGLPVP